jgi:hypothetical protein
MPRCTNNRAAWLAAAAVAVGGVGATQSRGAVLVTEFMPNPAGTDTEREWMEIYNSGPDAVDLTNWKVGDEEAVPNPTAGGEGMFTFPAGTTMQPGDVLVIAVQAGGFEDLYGFKPDFEFNTDTDPAVPQMTKYTSWGTGSFSLGNDLDHALVVDPTDTIVSLMATGTRGFDVLGTNETWERVPADAPNPDHNFASGTFVRRLTGEATPGVVTVPEPASLALAGMAGLALVVRRRRGA